MDRVAELLRIKSMLRESAETYTNDYIEVGDYSYGVPNIESWNDKTKLKIGKFCSIAQGVSIILGGEHRVDWGTTYPFSVLLPSVFYITGHPNTKGNVNIGNDVWLAGGSKILSGVTIGDGAVVSANSLVVEDVPPYAIVGGVPAKVVRYRFPQEIVDKLEKYCWWDLEESELAVIIPYLLSQNVDELLRVLEEIRSRSGKNAE